MHYLSLSSGSFGFGSTLKISQVKQNALTCINLQWAGAIFENTRKSSSGSKVAYSGTKNLNYGFRIIGTCKSLVYWEWRTIENFSEAAPHSSLASLGYKEFHFFSVWGRDKFLQVQVIFIYFLWTNSSFLILGLKYRAEN